MASMASTFVSQLVWSGALQPSRGRDGFSRDLAVTCGGVKLPMSAAPEFHGDPLRANPEQLFVASLSSCQALTFLFLAARQRIAVTSYSDAAVGTLETENGRMRMTRVVLRPRISVCQPADAAVVRDLVERAHRACFIANSITAHVALEPVIEIAACAA